MSVLPHSLESEEAVLGSILCDPRLASDIFQRITPADFYAPAHESIAAAVRSLESSGQQIDKVAVIVALRDSGRLEKAGGAPMLSRLMDTVQTSATAMYHAKIVAEKAQLRRLHAAGSQIMQAALDGEGDVRAALAEAESVLRMASSVRMSDGVALAEGLRSIYKQVADAADGVAPKSLLFPWRELNRVTGGAYPGELVCIAAAPGTGKSSLSIQIVEYAVRTGSQAIVFALEMGNDDTIRRMLASRSRLEVRALRRGELRPADLDRIGESMSDLSALPIWLYDSNPRKSVADIRRICRSRLQDGPLSVIVVDHPGYLREAHTGSKTASKHERLEYVYQELKLVASEVQTPVIAVQHLNRAGMDSRPSLAHLRDGGNLEGHAHMVIFPYREDPIGNPSYAELIVAKNRDGATGKIPMRFDGAMFTWREAEAYAA